METPDPEEGPYDEHGDVQASNRRAIEQMMTRGERLRTQNRAEYVDYTDRQPRTEFAHYIQKLNALRDAERTARPWWGRWGVPRLVPTERDYLMYLGGRLNGMKSLAQKIMKIQRDLR